MAARPDVTIMVVCLGMLTFPQSLLSSCGLSFLHVNVLLPMSLLSKISYDKQNSFFLYVVSAFQKFPRQKTTRCFETVPSSTQELQRRNNFLLRRRQQALGY